MKKQCIALSILLFGNFIFASNSAVILTYHRVGNNKYPSTNVSLKNFKHEMYWLHKHHYHVLPLTDIVNRLKNNEQLPNKTIGISFDDTYKSVYTNALPLLKKYNFPFTLFISPKFIPSSSATKSNHISWSQINSIPKTLVTLGNHTYSHPHMIELSANARKTEINQAEKIIFKKTGVKPTLFAYPYGEYSAAIMTTLKNMGFAAAFSQTSGSNDSHSNMYSLQRFPINDAYHSKQRFNTITQTKALDITLGTPSTIVINRLKPQITFTLNSKAIANFNCYPASGGTVNLIKNKNNLYTINLKKSFTTGRNKINCTAQDSKRKIYWRGLFFYIKDNTNKVHNT
jgi:poly-beta-1,6-N-acetyl-D-glucosamine N-deacetylase